MSVKTACVLAAATLLCTYGMVGCAVYSFAVRKSLDLVFYGTLPLTVLCGLLCVVHIVLASRLAGREEAMTLCHLALGWKLLEIPYFLTNFVLWLLLGGAFFVVPGLQLGLVTALPLAAFATYLPVLSSSAYQLAAIRAAGRAGVAVRKRHIVLSLLFVLDTIDVILLWRLLRRAEKERNCHERGTNEESQRFP